MLSRAFAAQHVVGADGAITLAGELRAPDDEARVGLREAVELVVQDALAEEDHAVRATRRRGVHEIVVVSWRQVAHGEIAAAIACGFTDAREQFEEERMREGQWPALHARRHDGDGAL